MIEVKWELGGSEVDQTNAETTVRRLLEYHGRVLEGVQCPVHGKRPWLVVRGTTMKNLTVSVGSCCPALQALTDERLRRVSRREE